MIFKMNTSDKKYKYDIAISLCNQDVEYARQLVQRLNPSLNIFFYENRQHELITKSGPEEFARIFKEEARVVVIISRNEWSESYYTDIERNAIIDRTSVKGEGYDFLFVIPIEPNQAPVWYPSTRIYADPRRFSLEELVKFIEFKVVETGGILKQITVEEKYELFNNKMEQKNTVIKLQTTPEAIEERNRNIEKVIAIFNEKGKLKIINSYCPLSSYNTLNYSNAGRYSIGDFDLVCIFKNYDNHHIERAKSTQDIELNITVLEKRTIDKEIVLQESGPIKFYYNKHQCGWAKPKYLNPEYELEKYILFTCIHEPNKFYDLKNPISSEELVDYWFQILLETATEKINRHL